MKSKRLKDALNYGRSFESLARQSYKDIMKFKLNYEICQHETSIVIQSSWYWLPTSINGMVLDKESAQSPGLIEVRCLFSKVPLTLCFLYSFVALPLYGPICDCLSFPLNSDRTNLLTKVAHHKNIQQLI